MKSIALHLLDILENSVKAESKLLELDIFNDKDNKYIVINIQDNGLGMTKEELLKVSDPFFTSRTSRKVGMGVPLLKQNAEQSGGEFKITSTKNKGTHLYTSFNTDNIDCLPIGDLAGVLTIFFTSNPDINLKFTYHNNIEQYSISTKEILESLGTVNINNFKIYNIIREILKDNISLLD